ncbi:MAG: HD domain-containing protein [Candidatus Koribacter versatilis]|uniref:HD domain-containing protein n=1 Tax=Candidatus Korobacter versatilis TaxID=658062 RepID=A0A932A8P8_9BACT|nr:HD domain-containing protein [Candidatus Koribacter versatilis]
MAVVNHNLPRLLPAFEALADLGNEMTADRDFITRAETMLARTMQALDAREGALFIHSDRPAMLTSVAAFGFALFPQSAVIPLLPKNVRALNHSQPMVLAGTHERYFSANGNVPPGVFQCVAPLRVNAKLVGAVTLGRRNAEGGYDEADLATLGMLAQPIAMAVQNHVLAHTLEHRIAENLRLLAGLHSMYDHTLEAFATAIDAKDAFTRGHSLRVGRYAAAVGEAMGLDPAQVTGLRAAGYLHDVGKVNVDKHLFKKPGALERIEFQEMADHTVMGHQIVAGVEFPWPQIPEVVRSHHERADGSGYPDHLHESEMPLAVRVVALADSFDAMTSERSYRQPLSLGETLTHIVRSTPGKFDAEAVQALLVQLRRDATRKDSGAAFLEPSVPMTVAPRDLDQLAADLNFRINNARAYSA